MEGTAILVHFRTSLIYVCIAFLNIFCQADVVCITIYIKNLIIDRETNWKSFTGSNLGLLPWGHDEPGSDANDAPLIIY